MSSKTRSKPGSNRRPSDSALVAGVFGRELRDLALPDESGNAPQERLTSPEKARQLYGKLKELDDPNALNRTYVQDMMDFVPPYDQGDLEERGQGDRFNVNYGMGASIRNDSVGAFIDLWTSPENLMMIPLSETVDAEFRGTWEETINEEVSRTTRAWDSGLPNYMGLADLEVTHGVAVAFFDDTDSWLWDYTGLDDMKFPKGTKAVAEKVEVCGARRLLPLDFLLSKVEGEPGGDGRVGGWHKESVLRLVANAVPQDARYDDHEALQREIKANQVWARNVLESVPVIYMWIREYDGSYSVYVAAEDAAVITDGGDDEVWLCKLRSEFRNVNQLLHIFPYSIGSKMEIGTIRGLGYFIYEACMADNILRCKMNDTARAAASQWFQPESAEQAQDFEFIDLGAGTIVPPGLKPLQQPTGARLDQSIIAALQEGKGVMERYSGAFARAEYLKRSATGRSNTIDSAGALEHFSQINAFAVNLHFPVLDKLYREQVYRMFKRPQTGLAKELVDEMRERIRERGVPDEVLDSIDFKRIKAVRPFGNGSRAGRALAYDMGSQLFASWDPVGQESYVYDRTLDIFGAERGQRYAKRPGQARPHVDIKLAMLENNDLDEGVDIDPVPGENALVHLAVHLDHVESGMQLVEDGRMELMDWTVRNVPFRDHIAKTLETATVHESLVPELNKHVQRAQQFSAVIENGLREIQKMKRDMALQQGGIAPPDGQGGVARPEVDPETGEPVQGQEDPKAALLARVSETKVQNMIRESQARMAAVARRTEAQIAVDKQKAMAKIALMDAETAAKLRRASMN